MNIELLFYVLDGMNIDWRKFNVKRICRVRPSNFQCYMCDEMAQSCNTIPDCHKCIHEVEPCELISVGTGFWSGDYAMVLHNGRIEKVSLDRIYDIKEEA